MHEKSSKKIHCQHATWCGLKQGDQLLFKRLSNPLIRWKKMDEERVVSGVGVGFTNEWIIQQQTILFACLIVTCAGKK